MIYGNSRSGQVHNRNYGKPSPGAMPSWEWAGGSIAQPRGKKRQSSIPRARRGWTHSHGAAKIAAQVCMNVIQQIRGVTCKTG